jgi:hypothetical protein
VLVRVIACLLSFYLYRLAARNGSSHCIGPKKQATCHVCFLFLCLFVCLFVWSLVCLCVLLCFSFVCFLVSLFFDDRWYSCISNSYIAGNVHSRRYINRQRIREISKKIAKLRNHKIFLTYTNPVFWIALKRNTFRMSLPKVIMIANTFTMSILRVLLKPNTFVVSFPEMIMIANVFTSQKHQISKKTQKKSVRF